MWYTSNSSGMTMDKNESVLRGCEKKELIIHIAINEANVSLSMTSW